MKRILYTFLCSCFALNALQAQEREELLPYGDLESWTVRYIKESRLLGGKTKTLYVVGPTDTIRKNEAYDFSKTIWGISNAYANVMGVAKGANTTSAILFFASSANRNEFSKTLLLKFGPNNCFMYFLHAFFNKP